MENAVDCQLNYLRNIRNLKDYSPDCEYQKCAYKCDGVDGYVEDISTYNLYYAKISRITEDIVNLFHTKFQYTWRSIQRRLRKYDDFELLTALNNIIVNNYILYNKWGIQSYLREDKNIFYLTMNLFTKSTKYINYYAQYVKNIPKVLEMSKIIQIVRNNELCEVLMYLNRICTNEEEICKKIFSSFPLDLQEKIIEYAILADIVKSNTLTELRLWLLTEFKNYVKLDKDMYIFLQARKTPDGKVRILKKDKWQDSPNQELKQINRDELFNRCITDNPIGFYGFVTDDGIFKIRDISSSGKYNTKNDTRTHSRGKNCLKGWKNPVLNKLLGKLITNKDIPKFSKVKKCGLIRNELIKRNLLIKSEEHNIIK